LDLRPYTFPDPDEVGRHPADCEVQIPYENFYTEADYATTFMLVR
jgi:hypothetical protein